MMIRSWQEVYHSHVGGDLEQLMLMGIFAC